MVFTVLLEAGDLVARLGDVAAEALDLDDELADLVVQRDGESVQILHSLGH